MKKMIPMLTCLIFFCIEQTAHTNLTQDIIDLTTRLEEVKEKVDILSGDLKGIVGQLSQTKQTGQQIQVTGFTNEELTLKKKLEEAIVQHNGKVKAYFTASPHAYEKVLEVIFQEKGKDITHLNISGKQLTKIKGLKNLTNLIYLDASDNQLNEVDLNSLNKLEYLNLGFNELTQAAIKNLNTLPKLKGIIISDNPLDPTKLKLPNQFTGMAHKFGRYEIKN